MAQRPSGCAGRRSACARIVARGCRRTEAPRRSSGWNRCRHQPAGGQGVTAQRGAPPVAADGKRQPRPLQRPRPGPAHRRCPRIESPSAVSCTRCGCRSPPSRTSSRRVALPWPRAAPRDLLSTCGGRDANPGHQQRCRSRPAPAAHAQTQRHGMTRDAMGEDCGRHLQKRSRGILTVRVVAAVGCNCSRICNDDNRDSRRRQRSRPIRPFRLFRL